MAMQMQMHVDRQAESASPDPEPVSAPTSSSSGVMAAAEEEEDATTATMESRSNTASPRPGSTSGATPASTTDTADTEADDENNIHHKPMELEEESMAVVDGDADVSSAPQRLQEQQQQSSQQLQQQHRQHQQPSYDMSSHNHKPEIGFVQQQQDGSWDDDNYAPSMGYQYSNARILPTSSSSFLRPGSKFHGTQQSERQVYDVQVEIKYVDFRESFLCGYLKIQGLTEDNPTLTTYFEGEIIGSKYGFLTQHPSWGANDKIDMNHWSKFTAFRQYRPAMRAALSSNKSSSGSGSGSSSGTIPSATTTTTTTNNVGVHPMMGNAAQRENIFMRWKEHFLVPDHRVRTINGASFEGFYYICFNQKKGKVDGIYFHSKSEKN
ncbi:putative vacuolar import and degradation protein [Eutypa lata UCREL1]|uniref:Putative vacuolar import and degradation protein n=1 Tax=Eutypa lata (strain UCR-EL1) TaxID=1287681 RepID=M7TBY2_EUTLA|nr:putative vacuolar import and degradation protein [Eutypa lata UCREL1]